MTPFYTLWDLEAGNSLGTYETEDEVFAVVHELIRANGDDYAGVLEIGHQGEDGAWRAIPTGKEIAARPVPASAASRG